MQQIRREAYGQDIGQHSWVTAEELAQDLPRLRLTRTSRLLDLGCGPGGPLTFVVGARGRRATGIDASPAAIASAAARAEALGLRALIDVHVGDANAPLPFVAGSFTAVLAIDVVLHLRGRAAAFADIARLLAPGGRVVFTDAGVITGVVSNEEIARRSLHGFTQFAAPGVNEELLKRAGLRLLERVDRTPSLLTSARGRLVARVMYLAEAPVA